MRRTLLGSSLALAAICLGLPLAAHAQVKQIAAGPVEAPFSLTAADGTGLELIGLDARAVVDGPLAFTELKLEFRNPHPRQIEGHFKVTMPDGAAISRFAMKIRGRWMEGEVVEKQAARRAYEDALHRRQDPALLEQDSGNQFRARVFPIPANGTKSLIISWSHELTQAGEAYRLPLLGLPKVASLKLTALTAGPTGAGPKTSLGGTTSRYQVSTVEKTDFKPQEDWVIFGGAMPAGGDALRAENLAVARFLVPGATDASQTNAAAVLAIDTSASRAIDFEARLKALESLIGRLSEVGVKSIEVIAFDQTAASIYSGEPAGFSKSGLAKLRRRGALGASSIEAAIDAIAATQGAGRRVIFLTDGMITVGEADREALSKKVAALAKVGIDRADVIVDTTARDALVLEMLVQSDLPSPGKVIEARSPLDAQLQRLGRATLGDVKIAVDGAKWVWPATARGLQPGDALVVFADLPAGKDLAVSLSGGTTAAITPKVRDAEKPLLERAWVAARIKRLQKMQSEGDPDMRAAYKTQILKLSTKHRVLSPQTALVVLETENDYRRFNIDRNALADILVVGATGVELMHRKDIVVAVAPPPPPPPRRRVNRGTGELRKEAARPRRRRAVRAKASAGAALDTMADDDVGAAGAAGGAPMGGARNGFDSAPAPEPEADRMMALPSPKPVAAAAPAAPPAEMAEQKEEALADASSGRMDFNSRRARTTRTAGKRRPNPFPGRRPPPPPPRPVQVVAKPTGETQGRQELRAIEKGRPSLMGQMASIDTDLKKRRYKAALKAAQKWRNEAPTDLVALVALGRSHVATGSRVQAARAFGSILDLYPSRADMRRLAGNWLEELGDVGLPLAADTYRVAMGQRPDHPSIYHQLSMVLMRMGHYEKALDVALEGIGAKRVENRFGGVTRILQEDAQLIAAAWVAAAPGKRAAIEKRLAEHNLKIDTSASMRFVLTWETDSNDVDFHIFDKKYNHAFYSRRTLASGGELYADITSGYGPECFTIYDPKAYNYTLKAHYYRRGPMGYGAGKIQVIRHDGKGGFGFEERPFVIMQDGAYVDLGKVSKKTAPIWKNTPSAVQKIAK